MLYVILNDGETFSSSQGCAAYDSVTGKLYSIRKRREINTLENMHWEKGMANIIDSELNTDNPIPGM